MKWQLKEKTLPLKYVWAISGGKTSEKLNFFVEAEDDDSIGMGEVSLPTSMKDSQFLHEEFESFVSSNASGITSFADLSNLINGLGLSTYMKTAIESAFIHLLAKKISTGIHEILNTRQISKVNTLYSLPLMNCEEVESFYIENNLNRFGILKVKTEGHNGVLAINKLLELFDGKIVIDGNESFKNTDDVMTFLDKISDIKRIEFLEQPLKESEFDEQLKLKKVIPVAVFADESLKDQEVTEFFKERFDGVNIKLMKCGGFFKALKQIKSAKKLGLKTMIGCMVESSLGIYNAMNIGQEADYFDLDAFMFFKEDPFNFVHEDDGVIYSNNMQ